MRAFFVVVFLLQVEELQIAARARRREFADEALRAQFGEPPYAHHHSVVVGTRQPFFAF